MEYEIGGRTVELETRIAELEAQLSHSWRDDYIHMKNNCERHMKRADELKVQLAAAQECVRIVEALEAMPYGSAIVRGHDFGWWNYNKDHNDPYGFAFGSETLQGMLKAAGLMKQEGE